MSYLDSEKSVRGGQPTELYKLVGTYETYYYSSGVRNVVFDDGSLDGNGDPIGPQTYVAVPIQRSEVVAGTQDDDGLDITIQLPATTPVVIAYGFQSTPPSLNLTIYRYHSLNAFVPYWVGPVSAFKTQDGVTSIQSTSDLANALATDFPNVYFQGPCNLILFDIRCKQIEANWSGAANVTAISANGLTVTVDAIPHGATDTDLDGQLVGGVLENAKNEARMIISQVAGVITVNFPFANLQVGDAVQLIAGCDHAYAGDCLTKFDNQINYGGFPFISANNPFTDGSDPGSTLPDTTCLPPHFDGWYWKIIVQEGFTGGTVEPPVFAYASGGDIGPSNFDNNFTTFDDGTYWTYEWFLDTDYDPHTFVGQQSQRGGGSHNTAHQSVFYQSPNHDDPVHDGIYSVMVFSVQYWSWTAPQQRIYLYSVTGGFPQLWSYRLDGTPV